jgi:hypothetical protein
MSLEVKELETVAWEARRQFEQGTVPMDVLLELCPDIYPHSKLPFEPDRAQRVLRSDMSTFPDPCCRLASVYLKHVIGYGEVTDGMYGNGTREDGLHVFWSDVPRENDTIIDITGDQYPGGPKVYVGPLRLPWRRWDDHRARLVGE